MAAIDNFINDYDGKWYVSFDGLRENVGQCAQLVALYVRDYLHLPVYYADAAYWFINFARSPLAANFTKVVNNPNDPNQLPQKGAIMVWSTTLPNSGGAGHISVFISAFPGGFMSFDSNWGGKYCHKVSHDWSYVLGWLHPNSNSAPAPEGDEMIADTDQATKLYAMLRPNSGGSPDEIANTAGQRTFASFLNDAQAEVEARNISLRGVYEQINGLQAVINQQNQTITDVTSDRSATKADLQAAIAKLAELNAQLATAHDKITDLQNNVTIDQETKNNVSSILTIVKSIKGLVLNLFKKGK